MTYNVGFIGTGNMGSALAMAVTNAGEKVLLADKDIKKAESLALKLNCDYTDTESAAKTSKYIFLGVKPQVLPSVLQSIKDILSERTNRYILVSMAAGTSIKSVTDNLGFECPVIRIMPNLPVSLGEGVVLHSKNKLVTDEEIKEFENLLSKSGKVIPIDEKQIDAASAISGCGPAFAYMFIEALTDGGVSSGLSYSDALSLASQTLIGASKMVLSSDKHPGKLRSDVCSPAGTTIEGVKVLEESGFRYSVMKAVIAAYDRTKELQNKK